MILLVGVETDYVLRHFASYLVSQNKEAVFLNQKKLGYTSHIYTDFIRIDNKKIPSNSFSGALNRLSDIDPAFGRISHHHAWVNLLSYSLDNTICNTLNPFKYCVNNNSKLYQLANLVLTNIKIPQSLVSAKNLNSTTQEYLSNIKTRFIFKSLSSIRSKVIEYVDMDTTSYEPILFQELILGDNIRVHVIKQKVIAIKICSLQIDYRYDESTRSFEEIQLPEYIIKECLELAKQTNLFFCGIDLIELNNMYYILEINPSPGYVFFENHLTNNIISQALLEALIE